MVILGKKKSAQSLEIERLTAELQEISADIERSDAGFNEISDGDLLEAAIYERRSLLARHSFLIKEIKRLGGK